MSSSMYPSAAPAGCPAYNPKFGHSNNRQYPLPPAFLQHQQRIAEAQRNIANTNFRGQPLPACHPVIPPYDWKFNPSTSPLPSHPPGTNESAMANGKKRHSGDHSPYNLKRQRFSTPVPQHGSPPVSCSSSSVPRPIRIQHSPLSPQHCAPQMPPLCGESPCSSLLDYAKDKLSGQMVELFEACQQQLSDLERKELCRAQLQREIQRLFPLARLYLAGSSLNGFGSRNSDADLCLVIQAAPVDQRNDAVYVLSLIQQLFYRLSYIERPQLIRAKVPILKFRDKVSGVEFDLNVNNTVGIRNTFLLRSYANTEQRVRPIILVIKRWARHHGINDASKGTLSSYTLVLMVLHYLQTLPEPVIPSLQKEYPECFSPTMEIHLVPERPKDIPLYSSSNDASLGELLLGFLKYYASVFSWDKQVISVREAKALPKSNSLEWRDKFICVEEPFDGTNTARAVHEKVKFDAIKAQFTESWQVLQLRKDLNFILPVRNTIQSR
ncbi:poly(A) RNA polymerase GLD2 isoform X2 [Esox lucius]|uniref:polynucleotide adenylyltransferase n=1 Tax=Esox lucius TaxID=8010 RepID=A0A3P8XAJ4_ESOLU|nr:poly(A) RNA polymerase GLD2 isoform X2 [Esox lucius]